MSSTSDTSNSAPPNANPTGPINGDNDSPKTKSEATFPQRETKRQGSGASSHGDAPNTNNSSAPDQRQVNSQAEKTDKQGGVNPPDEPKKSKEEEQEEEEGNKGTGQQYVKSSGTVSEGGDFDASNPGAGVLTS